MEEEVKENNEMEVSSSTTKQIVVFGKHDYIIKNTQNTLEKAGYAVKGFTEVEMARMYLEANPCDLLFVAGAVDPHDRIALKDVLDRQHPSSKILDHFGGPATILSEVESVFK
ncbi:MAG: hypothetical protein ACK4WD_12530 [Flavobacteriales bacterium]|jgi:PleD family two-component response regulator